MGLASSWSWMKGVSIAPTPGLKGGVELVIPCSWREAWTRHHLLAEEEKVDLTLSLSGREGMSLVPSQSYRRDVELGMK